jgi:hypothetical protein
VVHLVAWESHPSLLALLWHHGRAALAAGAAVLAALLWRSAFRRGPLLQPAAGERRSIGEHVLAAGRFLWRNRQAALLLGALRRERAGAVGAAGAAGAGAEGAGAARVSAGAARARTVEQAGGERSFIQEVAALCEGGKRD